MPYSGLTNAVISSDEVSEHDIEMIQKTVAVRDGDDAISITADDETRTDEGDEHIAVSIDTTGEEEEAEEATEEAEGEPSTEEDTPDFGTNIDPKDMNEAAEMLAQAEEGQKDVLAKALEGGVTQQQLDEMQEEFEKDNKLSDNSYELLEKAGLSKAFINSFMNGQVAVGERFAKTVLDYVGGRSNFDKLAGFMANNHSEMVDAFNSAMDRHDVVTIKALLDNGKTLMKATYGTRPQRSLTTVAKPVAPTAQTTTKTEGFTSRQEMVKAMSDKRYQRDAEYRREVERKVMNATF